MNRNNSGANTNTIQLFVDCLTILTAYLCELLFFQSRMDQDTKRYLLIIVFVFTVVYLLMNKEARIYNVTLFFYLDRFFHIITRSWLFSVVVTAVMVFVIGFEKNVREYYFIFLAISYLFLCINMIVSRFKQKINQNRKAPRAAFVGSFDDYVKFNYFLNKTSIKIEEIGFILREGEALDEHFHVIGTIDHIEDIIRKKEVDQVFFMQDGKSSDAAMMRYIDICLEMGVTVKVVINTQVSPKYNSFVSSVGTYPLVTYHTITLNTYEQIIKRVTDIVIGLVGVIVTMPLMLLTAIAIKLDSPGPIIFKQLRVGHNGRNFYMYKFRSMSEDAEVLKKDFLQQNEMMDGVMFKIRNDPRVTRVGRFIRRTSIDELPQLFNVLTGTMSLVGTRPPTLDEVTKYKRNEWRRISIKPGITGMWQVSGRSNITDFEEVVKLDLAYIDNWSPLLDIRILFQTVGVLLFRKGAY